MTNAAKSKRVSVKEILGCPTRGGLEKLITIFKDPPRPTGELLTTKIRPNIDGFDLWDGSLLVAPNIDPEKWRDIRFRWEMLIPNDKRPADKNIYCREPCGEYYTVIPKLDWHRKRGKLSKGKPPPFIRRLNLFLNSHRGSGHLHIERNAMTIGFIDVAGKDWGKNMRSDEISSLVPCTLAAMVKETELLGISGHGFKRNNHYYRIVDTKKIPVKGMSRMQLEFHNAWRNENFPRRFRIALWMHYVIEASQKEKIQAFDMTKDGYRFLIDDAQKKLMLIIIAGAKSNG